MAFLPTFLYAKTAESITQWPRFMPSIALQSKCQKTIWIMFFAPGVNKARRNLFLLLSGNSPKELKVDLIINDLKIQQGIDVISFTGLFFSIALFSWLGGEGPITRSGTLMGMTKERIYKLLCNLTLTIVRSTSVAKTYKTIFPMKA